MEYIAKYENGTFTKLSGDLEIQWNVYDNDWFVSEEIFEAIKTYHWSTKLIECRPQQFGEQLFVKPEGECLIMVKYSE